MEPESKIEIAIQHVTRARVLVAEQRQRVERLTRTRHDATEAKRTLVLQERSTY
jgi:hypothetical protein